MAATTHFQVDIGNRTGHLCDPYAARGCANVTLLQRKSEPVGTKKRILVLDDDPSALGAIERLLKVRGYDAQGFDAVDPFLGHVNERDVGCLILDIRLNGMSGIELKRQLTLSGILLPVIFITAIDSEIIRRAALEAGCVGYLPKPFSTKSLIDVIEAALEG